MPKEDNSLLLNNWLYKTISDNPRIFAESKSAKEIYEKIDDIFWIDCQKAFKQIVKEVLSLEELDGKTIPVNFKVKKRNLKTKI